MKVTYTWLVSLDLIENAEYNLTQSTDKINHLKKFNEKPDFIYLKGNFRVTQIFRSWSHQLSSSTFYNNELYKSIYYIPTLFR